MVDEVLGLTLWVGPDEMTISVRGEVDVFTGGVVRAALLAVLGQRNRLVLDLREVEFIDSAGLGAITDAWRAAEEAEEAGFAIAGPLQPPVQRLLEITGLAATLPVVKPGSEPSS